MKTLRSILLAIHGQRRTSRNLRDGTKQKLLRVFWGSVYLLYAFQRGFKAMRREQGLSTVIYQGRRCTIVNWAGSAHPTLGGKDFYKEQVPRAEIISVIDARELAHRFYMGVDFYLGSWYAIDVNRRVGVSQAFQRTAQ